MWLLGLAILGIAIISGSIAWMIGRSISRSARPARRPHAGAGRRRARRRDSRDRARRRGRRDGRDRPDLQGQCGAHPRTRKGRGRGATARRGRAPRGDGEPRQRFRAQRQRHRPFGVDGGGGHADHGAIDDGDRERRQRARRHRRGGFRKRLEQRRNGRGRGRRAVELGRRDFAAGDAGRARSPARRWATPSAPTPPCRLLSTGAEKIGEVVQADPLDRRADQSAGAQRHHRGGARRRIRPRLRRGRLRGEGAGQPDRQGHRGNLRAGRGDAGFDQRRGGRRSAASPRPSRR